MATYFDPDSIELQDALSEKCTLCYSDLLQRECVIKKIQGQFAPQSEAILKVLSRKKIIAPFLGYMGKHGEPVRHALIGHCNLGDLKSYSSDALVNAEKSTEICKQLITKLQELHNEHKGFHGNLENVNILLHKERAFQVLFTNLMYMQPGFEVENESHLSKLQRQDCIDCARIILWFYWATQVDPNKAEKACTGATTAADLIVIIENISGMDDSLKDVVCQMLNKAVNEPLEPEPQKDSAKAPKREADQTKPAADGAGHDVDKSADELAKLDIKQEKAATNGHPSPDLENTAPAKDMTPEPSKLPAEQEPEPIKAPPRQKESTPKRGSTEPDSAEEDEDEDEAPPGRQSVVDAMMLMISKLKLEQYYPQRLSLNDARRIGRSDRTDLVSYILYRLISQDPKCRNEIVCDYNEEAANRGPFHPLDVLVAIYYCADDFLRMTLTEKLFLCKLSIPLALPHLGLEERIKLLLLPLRGLVCEDQWGREMSITEHASKVVSFVRLGDTEQSKSDLWNNMLDSKVFTTRNDFYDDSPQCKMSRGVIDMAWMLPSLRETEGPPGDQPSGIVTLLNLHGSALDHRSQWDFLLKVSHGVLIIVSLGELRGERRRQRTLALLKRAEAVAASARGKALRTRIIVSRAEDGDGGKKAFKSAIDFLKRELPESWHEGLIEKEIKHKTCSKWVQSFSDEANFTDNCLAAMRGDPQFTLDETRGICEQAKDEGDRILRIVHHYDGVKEFKRVELPFQGAEWKQWVELDKKRARSKPGEGNLDQHQQKMKAIQAKRTAKVAANQFSNFMNSILEVLLRSNSLDFTRYFVFWLRLGLDRISRKNIPRLKKKHNKIWKALQEAKEGKGGEGDLDALLREFRQADQDIANASLGIEHVLREIGQIYEALAKSRGARSNELFRRLPSLMVDLVLCGQPVELMDGDASYVPINWAGAVLKQLRARVGVRNLLVLSVLGVQSSGKSTLLNAMFGLKFAVSAGRCTRGVYAQLIPAPRQSALPFSHVLVVDTEGLRAPELESTDKTYEHDHEIATYVLGMGNATIVNIKGENRAEMHEVMQIVLHAFLRMIKANRNIQLQPKCMFVHQNVAAGSAKDKTANSNRALLHELDEITKLAAETLNLQNKYKKFTDLVQFDVNRHAIYFADYLKGDPPMAPINEGYSNHVMELKELILEEARTTELLGPTDFAAKLAELWQGILKEDFIFSFRNAIEVRAYGSLEEVTTNLLWELKKAGIDQTSKAKHYIESCPKEQLDAALREHMNGVQERLQGCLQTSVLPELESFFDSSTDRRVLEQWKARTERKIKADCDEIKRDSWRSLEEVAQFRKNFLSKDDKVEQQRQALQGAAVDLAKKLKSENRVIDDAVLLGRFETLWGNFLVGIPKASINKNYVAEMYDILLLKYGTYNEFESQAAWLAANGDRPPTPEGVGTAREPQRFGGWLSSLFAGGGGARDRAPDASSQWKELVRECEELVDVAPLRTVSGLELKSWLNQLDQQLKKERNLIVGLAKYMATRLQKRYEKSMRENDLRTHFNKNHKEDLKKVFMNVYYENESDGGMQILGEKLAAFAVKLVEERLKQGLVNCLEYEKEFKLKHELQLSALRQLLKSDFEKVSAYLKSTEKSLKAHLEVLQGEVLFVKSRSYHDIAKKCIEVTFSQILKAIRVTRAGDDVTITKWLSKLTWNLKLKQLYCPSEVMEISKYGINVNVPSERVKSRLLKHLKDFEANAYHDFAARTSLDSDTRDYLLDQFKNTAIGCNKQCPFCKAICMRTDANHEGKHTCMLHYPEGLGRYRYEDSKKLVTDSCPRYIAMNAKFKNHETKGEYHRYRDYQTLYPDWIILPEQEGDPQTFFWKFMFAKYNDEFAQRYSALPADIPEDWKHISEETVFLNLDNEVTKAAKEHSGESISAGATPRANPTDFLPSGDSDSESES